MIPAQASPPALNGHAKTDAPDDSDAIFTRVMNWLPAKAREHHEFRKLAQRTVNESRPRGVLQEHALARILRGMWRMRPLLAADNNELDDKSLAAAEQSQARAEASWIRLRRLQAAERRAARPPGKSGPSRRQSPVIASLPPHPGMTPPPQELPGYTPPPELPPDAPLDWHDYIHVDPKVSSEFAVFKGTTVLVEGIVASLLDGTSEDEVFECHPFLTRTQLRAAMLCSADKGCVVEPPD